MLPKVSNDTLAGIALRVGALANGSEPTLDDELPKLSKSLFELVERPAFDEANGSKTDVAGVVDVVKEEEDDEKGSESGVDDSNEDETNEDEEDAAKGSKLLLLSLLDAENTSAEVVGVNADDSKALLDSKLSKPALLN